MTLPKEVIDFISESAVREGSEFPNREDDLFDSGILDSFGLVDFVSLLEENCEITVPDADIKRSNFRNLKVIEQYIEKQKEGE